MSVLSFQKAVEETEPFTIKERQYQLTDLGNAELFSDQHRHDSRYCPQSGKWNFFDGKIWMTDNDGAIERKAKETSRLMLRNAVDQQEVDQQGSGKLVRHALKTQSRARLESMIKLAQSEPGMSIQRTQFDADPWKLGCQNGVVDLKTGQLSEHTPNDCITRLVPGSFLPNTPAPIWTNFLDRVTGGNAELISFLQRAIGYSLTGSVREQCLFYLYGNGANGKSVFLEVFSYLMSSYAKRISFNSLTAKHGQSGINNDIARLVGARVVTSSEIEEGCHLNESLVKELTGSDTISARFLHQEYFEFKPEFKLWFAGNHKPVIRGTDHGIWRRIRLVPFEVTIPAEERDKDLPNKLLLEIDGILSWAIIGCLAWQREGLNPPQIVTQATDQYRHDSDLMGQFLLECCVQIPNIETTAKQLYARFKKWCEEGGYRPVTMTRFGLQLSERGFTKRVSNGVRWRGIGMVGIV